jgi:predicted DNA-binding protein with PD1-like motif
MVAFRLLPGQDLKTEIEKKVKENNWKAVALVSCVGSLEFASIRFANQKETSKIQSEGTKILIFYRSDLERSLYA